MFNRKYPHFRPMRDGCPPFMSPVDFKRMNIVWASVAERTGTVAFFDVRTRQICWAYTPNGDIQLVWAQPTHKPDGGLDRMDQQVRPDDIVRIIQSAKHMSRKEKDAVGDKAEREREYQRQKAINLLEQDRRKEDEKVVKHEMKKIEMGKHYKGGASVDGLKNQGGE